MGKHSFWTASFQCLAKRLLPALLPPHPQGGYLGFQVTGMIEGFFWV